MEKTVVIGGSGFIGRAIQKYVVHRQMENIFTFAFSRHPENIFPNLEKLRVDLLNKDTLKAIEAYPTAIYVAGSADHSLAKSDPTLDLDLNVRAFLNFMEIFRGSLVIISSQAVYYGLNGEILENIDHVPTMPYGISKKMMEAYANYFVAKGDLSKLWILRLMYAFGEGEKERRLIPRCARAVSGNERVEIFGGGKSFLNPLPSVFVARALVEAVEDLDKRAENFLEITNLNYPERATVGDVVRFLDNVKHFDYEIVESGEEWPVRFWGNTRNLSAHMKEWKINFPSLWDDLKEYFTRLLRGREHG